MDHRLAAIRDRELARFLDARPRGAEALARAKTVLPNGVPMSWMSILYTHPPVFVDTGHGAGFTDVDGNRYVDFNLADTSMFAGYGVQAITDAVADQMRRGPQFLLPSTDAGHVASLLAERFGIPKWQFTLSATQANTEALRVARACTGRTAVLMFAGKYHGHADELLGMLDDGTVVPEGRGVPADATRHVRIVGYNDLEAVERELARGDVAAVVTEAAITNAGVILPQNGFHSGLRRLATDAGALLIVDETHTMVSGPGGLTAHWGLHPDILVIGKSISAGIPLGAYGMTDGVAVVLEDDDAAWGEGVATGGTLFGNALSMAAARVNLEQVMTADVYDRTAALGKRLADGIETTCATNGLQWRSHRLFNRSGYTHGPELPTNAEQAQTSFDTALFNVQRIFMANRGIWEAIDSAGPAVGIQTTADHVDRYLSVLDEFFSQVCSTGAVTDGPSP